jgi:hypothetical protein
MASRSSEQGRVVVRVDGRIMIDRGRHLHLYPRARV